MRRSRCVPRFDRKPPEHPHGRLTNMLMCPCPPPQKSDAFREDLAFTCQVWKGYENRVQSHCTVAADASAAGASSAR